MFGRPFALGVLLLLVMCAAWALAKSWPPDAENDQELKKINFKIPATAEALKMKGETGLDRKARNLDEDEDEEEDEEEDMITSAS